MKKLTVVTKTILLIFIFATVSCQSSPTKKYKDAQAEEAAADKNLEMATDDYMADMENYKKEIEKKTSANEQSIMEFKARIAESKKEAKDDYEKEINDLEKKNTDMKRRLDEYKIEGKEQWDSFKTEFNHDMDELGNALKDLTVDNE